MQNKLNIKVKEMTEVNYDEVYCVLRWQKMIDWIEQLSDMIKKDGFEPDSILAIARGGLIPGRLIADHLRLKSLYVMKVEFYTNEEKGAVLKEPKTTQECPEFAKGEKVLVVDDISDSGESLIHAVKALKEKNEGIEVKVAVLYRREETKYIPDYCIETEERWVIFPFEEHEFLQDRYDFFLKTAAPEEAHAKIAELTKALGFNSFKQ
jgi:hypothetical protein